MQDIKQDKDAVAAFKPQHPLAFKALNIFGRIFDSKGNLTNLLHVDSMMDKARRKTGLNDFGAGAFFEGFKTLIDSLNKEARLTTLGRITMHVMLFGSLIVRLKVQDWVKGHPEALKERIEKPFIIAGMPRTGTTLLSFLMDMDPENRSLRPWEVQNPAPPPQLASAGEDPRIIKSVKALKMFEKIFPGFQTIHPISVTIPTECVGLFAHEFTNPFFNVFADIPSYQHWFENVDMESSYQFHKLILKILQYTIPVQTWSLKSPIHIFRLKTLLKTYPDARLIFTYRDPQETIPSACSLMACFRSGLSNHVDLDRVGLGIISYFKDFFEKLTEFENEYTVNNSCHLQYKELIKDPIETVRKTYHHFGKEVLPLHEKRMRAWLRFNPQHKHGWHKYSLADFGLTAEKVEDEFGKYRVYYIALH